MQQYNNLYYRIAGKFGRELNLAVWRSILQSPKFPTRVYMYGDPVPNRQIYFWLYGTFIWLSYFVIKFVQINNNV